MLQRKDFLGGKLVSTRVFRGLWSRFDWKSPGSGLPLHYTISAPLKSNPVTIHPRPKPRPKPSPPKLRPPLTVHNSSSLNSTHKVLSGVLFLVLCCWWTVAAVWLFWSFLKNLFFPPWTCVCISNIRVCFFSTLNKTFYYNTLGLKIFIPRRSP